MKLYHRTDKLSEIRAETNRVTYDGKSGILLHGVTEGRFWATDSERPRLGDKRAGVISFSGEAANLFIKHPYCNGIWMPLWKRLLRREWVSLKRGDIICTEFLDHGGEIEVIEAVIIPHRGVLLYFGIVRTAFRVFMEGFPIAFFLGAYFLSRADLSSESLRALGIGSAVLGGIWISGIATWLLIQGKVSRWVRRLASQSVVE